MLTRFQLQASPISFKLIWNDHFLLRYFFQMVDYRKTEIGGTRLKRSFDVAFLTGVDVNVKADVNDVGDGLNSTVDDGVAADVKVDVKAGGWDISRANPDVKKSQTDSINDNVLSLASEEGNMLLRLQRYIFHIQLSVSGRGERQSEADHAGTPLSFW